MTPEQRKEIEAIYVQFKKVAVGGMMLLPVRLRSAWDPKYTGASHTYKDVQVTFRTETPVERLQQLLDDDRAADKNVSISVTPYRVGWRVGMQNAIDILTSSNRIQHEPKPRVISNELRNYIVNGFDLNIKPKERG